MMSAGWIAGRRGGIALGVVLSVAAGGAYLAGLLDGLNNVGLDLHFRYLGDVPADPRIVLIDIDDQSLAALADWPWPRRLYADLVNTLRELGAKTIALDVILAEPTAPRVEHAGLGRDYDLETELSELGDRASDPPIYDDDELRDAIQDANVYLPMYAPLTPPGHVPAHVLQLAFELVQARPGISPDQLSGSIDLPPGWSAERLLTQARIAVLLEADFTLDDTAVTAALGGDSTQTHRLVQENLAAAKRLAAERAARRFFQDHSAPVWREFVASTMPGRMPDELSADRKCLIDAFRAERSRRVITNLASGISVPLAGYVQHAYDAAYPLDKFAEAAGGIGFVAFGREKSDGVLRSVPMVVDVENSPVPQLGLLVATNLLGADTSFRYKNGALIVDTANRPLRIPVDGEGRTLINWHVPKAAGGHRDWRNSFNHVPAALVLEIPRNRRTIADNDRRLTLAKAELLQTRHIETVAEFARYADLIRKRDELKAQSGGPGRKIRGMVAAASAMPQSASSELQSMERSIREMEEEAIVWLQRAANLWRNEQPRDDAEAAERAKIDRLYEWFNEDRLASRIAGANRSVEARNAELREELLTRIGGNLCLVGYTASGVADLVTTPIHSQAPGVIAHANIINMVLQNRFLSRPSWKWDFTFVVLAGV
ncbi:MAG: CHASE2 domain-containing protein, partial [Phycisphaerales bacterium]|nr:CHASE2 domain-containing protein [Phycisphaerales bacterium]